MLNHICFLVRVLSSHTMVKSVLRNTVDPFIINLVNLITCISYGCVKSGTRFVRSRNKICSHSQVLSNESRSRIWDSGLGTRLGNIKGVMETSHLFIDRYCFGRR